MLSQHTIEKLYKRINQLAKEFSEQHFEERTISKIEKENVGILLAMRPWELSVITGLRKQ